MEQKFTYQDRSPRLEELLTSIERPGEFCTHGRISEPMPRMEVENIGILSFPVPKAQIEELIQAADPAPYGKGTQTLVDASVRNCWQISADRLSLGGRSWEKTLRRMRHRAADGLGCPGKQLKAQLYKLLVYPPGGFFIPHRDTEKSDGMIATLTVSLPAEGTGGELIVRQKSREMTVEMNVSDPSELAYAAFYADCQHEIKEVQSGHRIALVYNLCLDQEDIGKFGSAPDYTEEVGDIAKELQIWCSDEKAPNKLVWILEHQYSQAGMSFSTFKNGDRAVAGALRLACDRAECELYASIVNAWESYYAWFESDGYDYGGWQIAGWEIGEFLESETWMDSWAAPDGGQPNFGKMSINDHELMPAGVFDDTAPDDEDIEEATGNEGATLERTYRFAALVLFKRTGILEELVSRGAGPGVAWIAEELSRNAEIVNDHIIGLAENLISVWPDADGYYCLRDQESISEMLHLLVKLRNSRTSLRFLQEIAIRDYRGSINDNLAALLSTLDPTRAEDILRLLICRKFSSSPDNLVQMLMLLERKINYSIGSRQRLFATCAAEILQLLPETLSKMKKIPQYPSFYNKPKQSKFRKKTIKGLVKLFWHADAASDVLSMSEVFANYPAAASLDRKTPEALVELRESPEIYSSDAYSSLWSVSASCLLDRSGNPPEPPNDWRIPYDDSCRCPQCSQLREFCENPEQSVARFPLKKDLRAHLHQKIDANQLDITHETERKGRPYTLVCTKNRATYKCRLKEYAKDVDHMNVLIAVMPGAKLGSSVRERYVELQVAVELSRQSAWPGHGGC